MKKVGTSFFNLKHRKKLHQQDMKVENNNLLSKRTKKGNKNIFY